MPHHTLPVKPGLASLQWTYDCAIGETLSPFTLRRKAYDYGSSRLRAVCVTPPMSYDLGLRWQGMFAHLKMTGEPFEFGPGKLQDVNFPGIRRAPGNPVTWVAQSSGNVFQCRGFDPDNPATLSVGWLFAIQNVDGEEDLYMIRESVTGQEYLDGNGHRDASANVKVFPALRNTYAAGKWLHFIDPKGLFYVVNFPVFRYDTNRILQPLTFEVAQV